MTAALNWLAATERAADRIGFVIVGDLPTCVRSLEREQAATSTTAGNDVNRILELVWASVTEELLAVRGRVEGWSPAVTDRRKTSTLSSVEPRN